MNVATLTCDKKVAADKYAEYLRATEKTPADEACKRVFRAIAKGKRVLNLCEAMRLAGTDHRFRPRLAVARAGGPEMVSFQWSRGMPIFGDPYSPRTYVALDQPGIVAGRVSLPAITFPRQEADGHVLGHFGSRPNGRYVTEIVARLPAIPPSLRPPGSQAKLYHILWEVDEWTDSQDVAPRHSPDPMLLRHLTGWAFVVVAEWNLTDVERQVLDMTLTART